MSIHVTVSFNSCKIHGVGCVFTSETLLVDLNMLFLIQVMALTDVHLKLSIKIQFKFIFIFSKELHLPPRSLLSVVTSLSKLETSLTL